MRHAPSTTWSKQYQNGSRDERSSVRSSSVKCLRSWAHVMDERASEEGRARTCHDATRAGG